MGCKLLDEIGTLFTPDTILRWHRMLVADKWNHADKRKASGRPPIAQEVVELVLKFAKENLTWGYGRIADALANLGHEVSDQSVGNMHGIQPAQTRKRQTDLLLAGTGVKPGYRSTRFRRRPLDGSRGR